MRTEQKISDIIVSVSGRQRGCSVIEKRIQSLRLAGFPAKGGKIHWNFGKTGTVKKTDGGYLAQLGCATGGRGKNGYGVNACPVFFIQEASIQQEQ